MKKYVQKITGKDLKVGQIMGINVLSTTMSELLVRVEGFISCSREPACRQARFSIVTPNPELILMAQQVPNLKIALNDAEFPVPDGIGLKLAIPDLNIIKGRDLFMELIKLADKNSWKVFLLGGDDDEANISLQKLQTLYPKLIIKSDKFVKLDKFANPVVQSDTKIQSDVINQINSFSPQLLFVAFGNPKQEIWVHKNLSKLNIGGAMCVGGTFRYIAGLTSLPPKWMGGLGLEWFWRLITEPKRLIRIFNAVVVFPIKLLLSKIA